MMPKKLNAPIGECPCPTRGCDRVISLFRFEGTDDPTRRRFAGKLYGKCEDCGKVGADGAAKIQDYFLEHGTIWDDRKKAEKNAPPPAPPPVPAPEKTPVPDPVKETPPAPKGPEKRPDLWDM